MIHLSNVTKTSAGGSTGVNAGVKAGLNTGHGADATAEPDADTIAALQDADMLLPSGSYASLEVDHEATATALFRLIMAYDRPDCGTVRINDIDVSTLPRSRVPFLRRNIGMLGYKPTLAENLTVMENLAMPLKIAGFNRNAMRERIAEKLKQADLDNVARLSVKRLDASQRQILACARATVNNPQTILASCPTTDLTADACESIYGMLETCLLYTSDAADE